MGRPVGLGRAIGHGRNAWPLVNSKKRSKAAASAAKGKPGTGEQQPVALPACNMLCERKEKFTLFSDHNGSLLRRQPGVMLCDRDCKHTSINGLMLQPSNAIWKASYLLLVSAHIQMAIAHVHVAHTAESSCCTDKSQTCVTA